MNKRQRARAIERAMRLTWSSLQTHLPYASERRKKGDWNGKALPGFEKRAVQEYAELIFILSKLY